MKKTKYEGISIIKLGKYWFIDGIEGKNYSFDNLQEVKDLIEDQPHLIIAKFQKILSNANREVERLNRMIDELVDEKDGY